MGPLVLNPRNLAKHQPRGGMMQLQNHGLAGFSGAVRDPHSLEEALTHRPQSSSFLGLPYRILYMNTITTLGPMGRVTSKGTLKRNHQTSGVRV